MCTGPLGNMTSMQRGGLFGIPQPSPYASNYGYANTSGGSSIDAGERQWYIDNGFGDPMETLKVPQYTKLSRPLPLGRNGQSGSIGYMKAPDQSYYRGVSREARYLYTTAADRAKAISDLSAQGAQERANASNVRVRDQGVTYNYAGNALAIPGT